jgi:GR25 family glycosyltransferase involved in LPS biosynthesis
MDKIAIFVITLQNSLERQKFMSEQFGGKNIPFEFIYGTRGRDLNPLELSNCFDNAHNSKYYFKKDGKSGRGMTAGEIGCALSHRQAYKNIIDKNIECAIILEDDISVTDDFSSVYKTLSELKLKRMVIKLDRDSNTVTYPWHKIKVNNYFSVEQPRTRVTFAYGYYIDRKAASILYNLTKKIFVVADEWDYYKYYIKLRILNKSIIHNNETLESIIGDRSAVFNTFDELQPQKTFFTKFYSKYRAIKSHINSFIN